MSKNLFDVVILVGPNDNEIIEQMLPYTKKNVLDHRKIYLICVDPTINIEGAITIDERIFPFSIDDISKQFGKTWRNGWYLQQLLKMYAGNFIPDLLNRYLVIDCDTHFLRPTRFITEEGKTIHTTGTENHSVYFDHMNRLDKTLFKIHPLSGISHHTMFNTEILNEMFKRIENNFNNDRPFWKLYLDAIDVKEFMRSAAAENELYFTYLYVYHKDTMETRTLKWHNTGTFNPEYAQQFDFVSVHWYKRPGKKVPPS